MKVSIQLEYRADRKEPLGSLVRRAAAAFDDAGLVPTVSASFADGLVPGGVSAVERALKRHPEMAPFDRSEPTIPGVPGARRLSTGEGQPTFPIDAVLLLADGVPRSLPFHNVWVHFGHPEFGEVVATALGLVPLAGVHIRDSWWVNGRMRSLVAVYAVDGDRASKSLPEPPPGAAAVLAALGKPRKTAQVAVPDQAQAAGAAPAPSTAPAPEVAAIGQLIARYRAALPEMVRALPLPHDLPPLQEALRLPHGSGPLKPALVAAFGPRGYDCHGEQGTFTLRRRTPANHVVDLDLDVGTWSRSVTAAYMVRGPGFDARLRIPVSVRALEAMQYPIRDTANWERIVANLAVVVDELDRTLLPEIEAAAGPAPEWFEPGRLVWQAPPPGRAPN